MIYCDKVHRPDIKTGVILHTSVTGVHQCMFRVDGAMGYARGKTKEQALGRAAIIAGKRKCNLN
jgi:hypothetical protein